MNFTNSLHRERVKTDCTKYIYLVPGVDMEDVTVGYDNGIFAISANRGEHYNYKFELHVDPDKFNPYKATACVARGVLTLRVPYGVAHRGSFSVPVSTVDCC